MKKIFKYQIPVKDIQTVEMPKGAAVLCVQEQGGVGCIWDEVDPQAEKICRCFVTYETGHPMDDEPAWCYVGTYQLRGGTPAFHVYTDGIEYPKVHNS